MSTDFALLRAEKALSGLLVEDDQDYLAELGRLEHHAYVATPASLRAELLERMRGSQTAGSLHLPWPEMKDLVCFEPGRWTLWSGRTHSGKTLLLRMLALHACRAGMGVLFASLEEEPVEFFREALYQAACQRKISEGFIDAAISVWTPYLKIFNHTGNIDPQVMLGVACHCAREYGVRQVVIDSLMKLQLRFDDYDGQRELGNLISRVAKQYHVHVHLVAHPRKLEDDFRPMSMSDVRGAGDVVNQADKVITIERAPEEEKDRARVGLAGDEEATNVLHVHKQRGDYNWTGRAPLYYHARSRQLLARPGNEPLLMLPAEAYGKQEIAAQPRGFEWQDDFDR